ncbi:MAG TPA: FtsK/SpoIIIE domain-containing protein [Phototrophicaceae bacterium]|nr:FtsK/SpoIIIE domain-containing protein [Phototrophicaceae bacterium]
MWRLSVLPSKESNLSPVDVVVAAEPDGSIADLAAELGAHLGGGHRHLLLAPTTDGRPWPASRRLADTGLHDGDVLTVSSVTEDWLTRPATQVRPRAVAHVLTGPDAGLQVPVTGDVVTIGRGSDAGIRLTDTLVSRTHAQVMLSGQVLVKDAGSAHGTRVAGRAVTGPTPVAWGEHIEVGGSVLTLREGAAPRRERGVLRPPRFGEQVTATELDLPSPPASPRHIPFPWPMMLMPALMGGAMFATTRSAISLVFMVGFPLMMVANHLVQRRQARREHEQEARLWREDVRAVLAALDDAAATQRAHAEDDEPELDVVRDRATSRHHRVWVRQVDDADFLQVRAGRGPRPALVTAKPVTSGDRGLRAEVTSALARRATLPDLPVPVPFAEHPLVAVVGETARTDAWARAVLVRLAVTHSPTDLTLAAALGTDRAGMEAWLRWLPHAARRSGGGPCVSVGPGEGRALLEDLLTVDAAASHTLLVVDEHAGLPRRAVEQLAAVAADPARRLRLLWLGEHLEAVPAATALVVDLVDSAVKVRDRGGVAPLTEVDQLDLPGAWRTARALSGYQDEAATVAAEALVPQQVRLPELAADLSSLDDVDAVLARWSAGRGLRAQLGAGADGVVTIDLREDGPHGLVAGTTGAGKSELLQSLISSLALNNPPSRITFLLVDYKGGAAFRECAELPHTVGYITDLTPALVQRALTSLHAELTSRERLLNEYGAKDLVALEASHPDVAPPSMLICVDEFAALLAEVPEFVDGMVSIAQRGRSLGMHMLLATQRPAGVVTPQIKANTDLRIALRVASPDDSVDVIDAPDAAAISRRNPGRAWLRRTGHGTRELVQVAWVGAREEAAEQRERVTVAPFTARGTAASAATGGRGSAHELTDLERIVATTTTAFRRSGRPAPKRPWIPAMPDRIELTYVAPGTFHLATPTTDSAVVAESAVVADDAVVADSAVVAESARVADSGLAADTADTPAPAHRPGPDTAGTPAEVGPGQALLGMVDRPAEQVQVPWVVDFARSGHLLVLGASGSGKTELLRTLAATVTGGAEPAPACVYAIDAGGGGLTLLERLPSVGSVVAVQQPERMLRLIRMLHQTVEHRGAVLAAHGVADVDALADVGEPLRRIHLLVDNLPAVMESLEGGGALRRQHGEQLVTILQEGRRCGVHVTATAPQRTGLPSQLQAAFGQRLVLRMSVADDYAMLGVPSDVLDADSAPGRGLAGRDEVQVATIGAPGTPAQAQRLDAIAAAVAEQYTDAPRVPVPAMPTLLPQELLPAPTGDDVVVGVEENLVSGVGLPLLSGPLLVTGRARSGRTTFLAGLAQLARRGSRPPAEVVLAGPRASQRIATAGEPADPSTVADVVLDDAASVAAWVLSAGGEVDGAHAGGPADRATDVPWRLVLVDDLHEWERAWEANGPERAAVEALTELVLTARRTAVVVATDPDEARARQHVPGLVAAVRRSRRAILLGPEMGDGTLVSAQVPMNSHEAMTGPGRGLLVSGGTSHVVHVLSASAVEGDR